MQDKTPSISDIARQTLLQLAALRLPPTPEHYARIFAEISGQPLVVAPVQAALQKGLETLAAERQELQSLSACMLADLQAGRWDTALAPLLGGLRWSASGAPALAIICRRLVREWERRQQGLSYLQKQEALEFILTRYGDEPAQLSMQLNALLDRWGALPEKPSFNTDMTSDDMLLEPDPLLSSAPAGVPGELERSFMTSADDGASSGSAWRQILVQAVRYGVIPRLAHLPALQADAEMLVMRVGSSHTQDELRRLADEFRLFWIDLELRHGEELQLQQRLLRLLQFFTENVADLLSEDVWLNNQLDEMRTLFAEPLEAATLLQAEERFREIIYKQGVLKKGMLEAREALKSMAGLVIASIEQISTATGAYSQKVRAHADDLQHAENLDQINLILKDLLQDSAGIEAESRRLHQDLLSARDRLEQAEQRIYSLESELEHMNHLLQEDPLTGALNRRGLQIVFERETGRAQRQGGPLSVAVLDIDHFKRINDHHGHELGDRVLQHLVQVLKEQLRPADCLARVGGEEFALLLPETPPERITHVLTRLQSILAQRPIMHAGTELSIQFSAGASAWTAGESLKDTLRRADEAMYDAKRAGRNQVVFKALTSGGT